MDTLQKWRKLLCCGFNDAGHFFVQRCFLIAKWDDSSLTDSCGPHLGKIELGGEWMCGTAAIRNGQYLSMEKMVAFPFKVIYI